MTIKATMTVWDNTMTVFEKQDILLYCERAMRKACGYNYGKMTVSERKKTSITFEISAHYEAMQWLLNDYNERLNRLTAWRKENADGMEILVWENEYC